MHGFFVDIRLYKKAKSAAEPFDFEDYKKNKISEKLDEGVTNRVKVEVSFMKSWFHFFTALDVILYAV